MSYYSFQGKKFFKFKIMRNLILHPTWVCTAFLLQQEQEPNESGLPFGDDEISQFMEEAMRNDIEEKPTPQQTLSTTAAVQTTPPSARMQPSSTPPLNAEDYIIDMVQDEVKPEFRFSINGCDICESSGITAISGHAKHGKSQFLVILASVLLSGRDFGKLKRLRTCESVLWVDTEQSKYNIQTNINRLYHLANIRPHTSTSEIGLNVLYLRDCMPETRREIIEDGIARFKPDFIIIDGLRDLIYDINSTTETGTIIQWLLSIVAQNENANIVCVLHNNPGDAKMRGHLGTELMNKCADHFNIFKDNGYFRVTSEKRDKAMNEDFCFRFDGKGNLIPHTGFASEIDAAELIKQIYEESGTDCMKWSDLRKRYAKEAGISEKQAGEAIQRCNEENTILEKGDGNKWYLKI